MKTNALVVDRRSMERNELTIPLKRVGVKKVLEANADELLAQPFKTGSFDVVFVEFNMLMAAGRDLIKSIRQMDLEVPIIVTYPGSVSVADLRKYCPEVSATLMTPFTDEQLRNVVEQHVFAMAQ